MHKNIEALIKNRRSIFPPQYNDVPITKEFIQLLLENANWAPSHRLTEPWRFKIIREQSKEAFGNFLADTYTDITPDSEFSVFKHKKIRANCTSASAIIAICMQRDPKERIPEWEEIASTAMAVQNMWLTCFEFEEGERCLGFFYLGNYNKELDFSSKRNPISDKTKWME